MKLAVLMLTLASLALSASASAAPPVLSHLFPAGGQRGTKVTVKCTGEFAWPIQAWSSGAEAVPASDAGKLDITIPADLPADRIWIRLHNAEGASATVPFLIGSLPEIEEKEPNNSPIAAQPIESPRVTVNGVLTSADVDGFAVRLEAGQTLVAALDANTRLGSPIDAIVQVALPDGTVLAENHDDLNLDPRLAFTAKKAGTYLVRLFAFSSTPGTTIAFYGAANCVYRLTITTGPYITHSLPLAAPQSNPATVELQGWNLPAGARLPIVRFSAGRPNDAEEFEPLGDLRVSPDARIGVAFSPDFAGAARIRLQPGDANPAPTSEGALSLPAQVSGWLTSPGQADVYRLPLKKGQTLVAAAESRTFGLLLDPLVRLADPNGATVAEIDDTGAARDAVLVHAATHDGEYRLTVRDRYRQFGPRCCYLLAARLEEPDFEVSATGDAVVVASGKSVEIPLKIVRRTAPEGSVGPITIEALGLPPDVQAPAVVSEPTGPTATDVKLIVNAAGPAFSGPIRIVGKAAQPKAIARIARTPPKLGASLESVWLTVTAAP